MLGILADLADDLGLRLFPSAGYLARLGHYRERWVRRVVAKLRARGWVEVVRPGGGRHQNLYRLHVPTIPSPQNELPWFSTAFCGKAVENSAPPGLKARGTPGLKARAPLAFRSTAASDLSADDASSTPAKREADPLVDPLNEDPLKKIARASEPRQPDDDERRLQLEGLAQLRMTKARLETTPAPARRRHRR